MSTPLYAQTRIYNNGVYIPRNQGLIHISIRQNQSSDMDILTGFMGPISKAFQSDTESTKERLAKSLKISRQSIWRRQDFRQSPQFNTPLIPNLRIAAALGFTILVTPGNSLIKINKDF